MFIYLQISLGKDIIFFHKLIFLPSLFDFDQADKMDSKQTAMQPVKPISLLQPTFLKT